MPTPPLSEEAVASTAAAYRQALAEGCTPLYAHVGLGKKSAATRVAELLGMGESGALRRLKIAEKRGALDVPAGQKPRIRVKAGSAPVAIPAKVTPTDRWLKQAPTQAAYLGGPQHTFTAEQDGTFTFGACGDQHMCSKYERLDVAEALYDAYAEAGCSVVLNTGNWIDGEARFNVHDLHTRGMDAQLRYLARAYPRRPGITTYAVSGDDHEGWFAQREGIDIGRHAERTFRDVGRTDWIDLGYMEAPVRVVHPRTGKAAIISVTHPGGGSSYALSYSVQKIIESLDGGEKPAVLLAGHYHKLWAGSIRNVWAIQTGCSQDQTPFMRKKKLEAHVGGCLVKLTQDPDTGAIVRCQVEIIRFFHRGYYENRWNHHGPVNLSELAA